METFYVVVAPGPCVVVCNRNPLRNGTPGGYRAYVVLAHGRDEAKRDARDRFARNEPSDSNAWGES